METGVLFQSIQNDQRDPAALADEFINAKFPLNEATLKLTQLLVYSCGIKESIRETSVTSENLDAILDFIDEKFSKVRESAIPLNNSKYFKRCLSFFERIFTVDWNTFTNSGNFDTSFVAVIEGFSIWEPKQLHVISFAIKLKLVTAFLPGGSANVDQNVMPKVKKYAAEMLKKAIFYKTVQCSILAATELYEWIKKDVSFATDENLRVVAWMMKMEKPKQVCHGMLIAYSLLRMEHLQDKMILFARKLVSIFEDLCYTENNNIFDWICRCSELIYKHHREAILPAYQNNLLDNLFAKDRQRAKSAAGFWMGAIFDPACHRSNFRIILNFLEHVGSDHWKVLVDSIIDDYSAIVDWNLLVNILLDEEDGVPEETRLTMTEKEKLLKLMSYVVEELVNGFPPEYRAENMKTLSLAVCHDFACKVTEALVPVFWKLFHLEYTNKERAQITLIYIAKFFNFTMIERQMMVEFVQESVNMFKTSRQAFCHQVVLDLLRLIVNNVRDTELTKLCDDVFNVLKEYCESQMIDLVKDFLRDPNDYKDLQAECVQTAEGTLIRILALNRVMLLDRKVIFDIPQEMLHHEILPNNPVFLCIVYVCVCLMCEHVIYSAKFLKQLHEEEQNIPDNYNDILDEIDFTIKHLSIRLKEWYPWNELSVSTFFNLCKVLEAVRDLPLSQDTWNSLVTLPVRYMIVGYVAHMVWKSDDEWGAVSSVNEQTKVWIMNAFLNLIECKVLPLSYTADPMTNMNKQPAAMEHPLRQFVSNVCATEEESTVVNWLLKWMICLFELSSKDCLDVVACFAELIYPIRKPMQDIIHRLILRGVDFALSGSQGGKSPASRHDFLNVMAKLCECLDDAKKTSIEKHFTENRFDKENVKVLKSFLRRIKKKPASKKVETTTPQQKSVQVSSPILSSHRTSPATLDDNFSVWSASSRNRSSSVLADESDLNSMHSGRRPILMFRSDNENVTSLSNVMRAGILIDEMSTAAPLASSTPINLFETLAKNTSPGSGEVHRLFQGLQMRSTEDNGMDISSSVSVVSENIHDGLNESHETRPTEQLDEVMSVSAANPVTQSENTSQVLDNVSDLLKNQRSPSSDVRSVEKSPTRSVPSDDISDVSMKAQAMSPANSVYNVSNDVSPRSSASFREPDTQSFVVDAVSKLLKDLRQTSTGHNTTSSSSPMSDSSKEGDEILRQLRIKNPKALAREKPEDGSSNVERKRDSQTVSQSQAYKNATNLLRSLEPSSGEDYDMMKNSSVSESGEDSAAVDIITPAAIPIDGLLNNPSSAENHDLMKNSSISESGEDGVDFITPPAIPIHGTPNEPSSAEKYDMMKNLTISDSGDDEIEVITSPVIPFRDILNDPSSASSITAKLLDARSDSASQLLQNINELLNNSQSPSQPNDEMPESPNLSESSGEALKDLLSAKSSPSSCPEVSMDISFISSPPANSPNTQTENTARAYGEVSKLLKTLDKPVMDDFGVARSPAMSESSEENDDVFKNLQLESPTTSSQAVRNVARDLFGPSAEEEEANQRSGSSIIENLQRVSLSNAETETENSDSSAFDFAKSPLKKKGRYEF
ncbi:uncharacterized protein LOC135841367 [Planococcus citri]|uniref:uncharacterized protein LOC135841367 n=1 Tax=Planococcus citri TaxID=170843 RepID=UPI0031F8102D